MTRAAVVGLGLIGGSAALALSARGFDRDPSVRRRARELGVETVESFAKAVEDCDLVLLAVPTKETPSVMREATSAAPGALVTDAASLKKPIAAAAASLPAGFRFVGGHPMAGGKGVGLEGARADLFRGRPWLLVPTERSDVHAIASLQETVRGIGARPIVVDPDRHDSLMTWVSHLPHVAAAALARAVLAGGGENLARFAGPGLLDATRIADGPLSLLLELGLADPEALAAAIESLRGELAEIAERLRCRDESAARDYFERAIGARRDFEG